MIATLFGTIETIPLSPAVVNVDRLEGTFGREIVDALHAGNMLVRAGDGGRYPCDWGGKACDRELFLNHAPGSENPHFAVCRTWGGGGCPALNLPSEKVRVSEVVEDRLLILVRKLLGLPMIPAQALAAVPRAWHLGTRSFGGREKEVFVLLQPDPSRLAWALAKLGDELGASMVVLFTSDRVSPDIERMHLPGAKVELVFLEHHLRHEGGEFRWGARESLGRVADPTDDEVFGLAFQGKAGEEINHERYAELLADPDKKWDLVIDLKGGIGRYCRAASRAPDGRFVEVTNMNREEGTKLGDLIRCSPEGRRAASLYTAGSALRWVQRARSKIDHQLAPNRWNLFQTLGGEKNNQEFAFRPNEPGCRVLLIVSLETKH